MEVLAVRRAVAESLKNLLFRYRCSVAKLRTTW